MHVEEMHQQVCEYYMISPFPYICSKGKCIQVRGDLSYTMHDVENETENDDTYGCLVRKISPEVVASILH